MSPPPSSTEKANVQSHLNNLDRQSQQQSQDLPPAYENTLVDVTTSNARPHARSRQSQPRISIPTQNPLHSLQRLSRLNFANYLTQVPASTLSADQTTVTTTHPELSSKQYALANFIREQAALPPKPIMVIRGFRGGHESGSSTNQVDFEIKANLTGLLDFNIGAEAGGQTSGDSGRIRVKLFHPSTGTPSSPSSSSSTMPSLRVRPNESPLDAWVRTFTTDSSSQAAGAENRTFTISRVPLNLPVSVLEGHVRTLIAATRYRGKVTVEFPVLYRDVVVSRTSGNWFVKLVGLYNVRRFEVVQCVWTVGGATDDEDDDGEATGEGGDSLDADREADRNARAGLVAQEWWNEWKPSILNAVLARKKGWITVEDWLEAKMGVKEAEKRKDWGFDGEHL